MLSLTADTDSGFTVMVAEQGWRWRRGGRQSGEIQERLRNLLNPEEERGPRGRFHREGCVAGVIRRDNSRGGVLGCGKRSIAQVRRAFHHEGRVRRTGDTQAQGGSTQREGADCGKCHWGLDRWFDSDLADHAPVA